MIRKTVNYPDKIKTIMNINSGKDVIVFYCDTYSELEKMAKFYDLNINTLRENTKYGINIYAVAYGRPYVTKLNGNELREEELDRSIYIYYTVIRGI